MSEQDTFGTSFQLNKLEATYTVCYDNDKPIKSAYFFQIIVLKKLIYLLLMDFGINCDNTELKTIENIERGTNLSFSSLIKT